MGNEQTSRSTDAAAAPKLVGALAAGLAILRHLGETGARAGVSRIARDLELNPSTCFNLLRTLVHEGMVSFDPDSKSYGLALGVVALAKGALEQASYARFMRPDLEAVSARHGVTATLWQRAGRDRMVLVDRAESDATMRVHMQLGQRLPLYVAAFGRCMAAHSGLSRAQLRALFRELRWERPPSFEAWWRSVGEARARGYAVDAGHFVRGATTVSSVVLDAEGAPLMALSAVGFEARLAPEQLVSLGEDLAERTATVGRALAGRGAGEGGG